jgi:hypothetical protein
VFSVEEALEQVEGTVVCAGNGAGAYRDRIQDTLGERAVFPPDGIARLNAASVGFMGMAMIHRGQYAALYELEPLYIRRPQYTRLSATESAV